MSSQSLEQWLKQGEALYEAALGDYRATEQQLDELEQKLVAKRCEVNQVAQMLGKPLAEGNRRLSAQLVSVEHADGRERVNGAAASASATIARAFSGKFGR